MDINTENIPLAEEITGKTETVIPDVENNETEDLISRMQKATEHKQPGTTAKKTVSNFWNSSPDDFEVPDDSKKDDSGQKKNNDSGSNDGADSKDEKGSDTDKKLTDKDHQDSADNATFFTETFCELVGKIAINKKFKNKFTENEREALTSGLMNANKKSLNETQLQLFEKYEKLSLKKEEAFQKMPFTDDEIRINSGAWFRYFKQKNKQLPPEAGVFMAVFTAITSRGIDIAID